MTKDQMNRCIYLDNHATTPLDQRVFLKMKPFFLRHFGNAASISHPYGWQALEHVNKARIEAAKAINAHPTEIIFTSGATEAINMAIKGLFMPLPKTPNLHIVSSSIEHGATLESIEALKPLGISSTLIKPKSCGLIDESMLAQAINSQTALISLSLVNNEIGVINNIASLAKIARAKNILFHCDAVQALGRVAIDCQKLDVDLMSFSGHKIYGPKGVGFLYIRKDISHQISPLMHGGGQEWHKRSGTLNVPGIVGMGEACRLATENIDEENNRIRHLRDRLLNNLSSIEGLHINGSLTHRVVGNLNLSFADIDGEELMLAICSQIAVSSSSACSSGQGGHSRVLKDLGLDPRLSQATLRLGLGRFNTIEDIDQASDIILNHINQQKKSGLFRKKLIKIGKNI